MKEEKLKKLSEKKRSRLMRNKNHASVLQEMRNARRALDLVDSLDNEEEEEEETKIFAKDAENLYVETVQIFKNLSVVPYKFDLHKLVKIIGLREFQGKIFAALLYEQNDGQIVTVGVEEMTVLKKNYSGLLSQYLQEALLNN